MRIIASAAVTSDGYIDDCSGERLIISCEKDWSEVYRLRAACDAILVGVGTLRKDNPSLVIRDEALRRERLAEGKPADITKVVISSGGDLDTNLRFFTQGAYAPKIVILRSDAPAENITRLRAVSKVIVLEEVTAAAIEGALIGEGIGRLMVEGGAGVMKMFIDQDMIDEFRLAISPHELSQLSQSGGDNSSAARLPYWGCLPFEGGAAKATHKAGEMTVVYYTIHGKQLSLDREYLHRAIRLSKNCAPCQTAYCVGCVIMTRRGQIFEGYTHETGPANHAEEEAIAKAIEAGAQLEGATIYTSMEPCSRRASKPASCSELIIKHGMSRVVYAYEEPEFFVRCDGTRLLREAGIRVDTVPALASEVIAVNSHIIPR